jgi:adenylosuccinate synthase
MPKKTSVKVVIGANFGDEGKGLMTDYFASQSSNSVVVRFNGGGQAGHTVVTPDGTEHVFSNIGSGSLNMVSTYLSRFFLVNPILFNMEYDVLQTSLGGKDAFFAGKKPRVYVDKGAILSTPYDMMLNQLAELSRGDAKHGSCGMGISETVVRSDFDDSVFKITISDLLNFNELKPKLLYIRDYYVPQRLLELGITDIPVEFQSITSDELVESFIADCAKFINRVTVCELSILGLFENIVFEGAQGLLLDQDFEEYAPHITHSSTGFKNVSELLSEVPFDYDLEVCYVTRCYLTRHGEGPFPTEIEGLPYSKVVDKTNIPNQWQGSLRFGLLDVDQLHKHVYGDLSKYGKSGINFALAVTCLDQVDKKVKFHVDGDYKESSIFDFLGILTEDFSLTNLYGSWGRTRDTVNKYI